MDLIAAGIAATATHTPQINRSWAPKANFPSAVDDCREPSTTGEEMLIAILNQSTLVSNADAATMTQAIAAQVRLDVAPLWIGLLRR